MPFCMCVLNGISAETTLKAVATCGCLCVQTVKEKSRCDTLKHSEYNAGCRLVAFNTGRTFLHQQLQGLVTHQSHFTTLCNDDLSWIHTHTCDTNTSQGTRAFDHVLALNFIITFPFLIYRALHY